jgi:CRISPR/Cas system-associated endonuclease Cas3-HD
MHYENGALKLSVMLRILHHSNPVHQQRARQHSSNYVSNAFIEAKLAKLDFLHL